MSKTTEQPKPYEIVIGLEVHVQLATRTKLFCRCSTAFGAPPNTNVCPVCLGMPGALPVMNRRAFELALQTALALNLEISRFTKWDRKNYCYPDLPKGYQISQFDLPVGGEGGLDIRDAKDRFEPKRVGIIRAHLEEDAGKSMHDEAAGKHDSRIDLNRCGTPLMEIVSHPDMRSPAEARAFLTEMKLLLTYLGVSDCNMQEGSLRVDANINLHIDRDGETIATPIVEVKNMNSFRAVERALEYEATRQFDEWQETGETIEDAEKQTRGWDENKQVTFAQRGKEESSDYRYFPDPDLLPVKVSDADIEAARVGLGERPAALRTRLEHEYKIPAYDADVIVNQGRAVVDYFVELAAAADDAKAASNWVQQDVLRWLNETEKDIAEYPIAPAALGELIQIVKEGTLTTSRGREVLAEMIATGSMAQDVMKAKGIEKVDSSALEALCQELVDANPKIVADVQAGNHKALGALIGQAKKRNPNVNPAEIQKICLKLAQEK